MGEITGDCRNSQEGPKSVWWDSTEKTNVLGKFESSPQSYFSFHSEADERSVTEVFRSSLCPGNSDISLIPAHIYVILETVA